MSNLWLWLALGVPVYYLLTRNLKGRAASLAFLVYFWAIACALAINTWRFHQTYLSLEANIRAAGGEDFDPVFVADKASQHLHVLWLTSAEVVILFIVPVVWYWFDRRKERRTVLSIGATQ